MFVISKCSSLASLQPSRMLVSKAGAFLGDALFRLAKDKHSSLLQARAVKIVTQVEELNVPQSTGKGCKR
jgi:hypothetical protein